MLKELDPYAAITSVGAALSSELNQLAERVRRSVVEVQDGRGSGAGTIWSKDGIIVTNSHVVPGDRARIQTSDGHAFDARVIRSLPERDVAILKVDAEGLESLSAVDPSLLRPGELVMAVGHPFGIAGSVSLGIFSGIGPIERRRGRHFSEAVLSNIELRPGNSGGPLVTMAGDVVGINAMVLGAGTALAVPSSVVQRLIAGITRPALGLRVGMVRVPQHLTVELAIHRETLPIVLDVASDSLAAQAGLIPGDILVRVNDIEMQEPGDIPLALSDSAIGSSVQVRVLRGGMPRDIVLAIPGE